MAGAAGVCAARRLTRPRLDSAAADALAPALARNCRRVLLVMRRCYSDQILRSPPNPQSLISSNFHVSLDNPAGPRDVSAAVAGRQENPPRPVGHRQPDVARIGEDAGE